MKASQRMNARFVAACVVSWGWGLLGMLPGWAMAQSVRETARELVPQTQPALSAEAPPPGASLPGKVRTIGWEQLIPAGWDPFKDLKATAPPRGGNAHGALAVPLAPMARQGAPRTVIW